jgi:hypothetical protein
MSLENFAVGKNVTLLASLFFLQEIQQIVRFNKDLHGVRNQEVYPAAILEVL